MSNFTKEQLLNIIAAADEVLTALAGTNEELHRDDSAKMCAAWDNLNDNAAPPAVVKRLAQFALSVLSSVPVGYRVIRCDGGVAAHCNTVDEAIATNRRWGNRWSIQPVFDYTDLDAKRAAFIDSLQDETAAQQVEALARRGKPEE